MAKITWRIWFLIIILAFSLIAIFGIPPKALQNGVRIASVESNSTAFRAGLRQGQIITKVNGETIESLDDFTQEIMNKYPSEQKTKTIFQTNELEAIYFSNETPQITVAEISKTNIKTGLDLAGGARALVKAQNKSLTSSEVQDLIDVVSNRLNVYGIADMNILPVSDLAGNNYMLIEIAGATPEDLEELISQQGKFEAKIGNETVFTGGDRDITSVCRNDATCSGIERCFKTQEGGEACKFAFSIYLSEKAAQRHADITDELEVNTTPQGNYLSKKLDLYVDDNFLSDLLISESLKGQVTTQIQISGSGSGKTREEAYDQAELEMRKLQTILITGSLPYKLEIAKLDTISPVLGQQFIKSILFAGIAAILAVAIIVFFRYRNFKSSLALIITSISEVIIILGIASFIDWNLDLPSIAGILATIGTGIDSQIIVLDEARQKEVLSIKQKLKRAFAIILGAYFTALVALLPLLWAGAGLLKGFAITTIIGITTGVLITRPAFTDMIRNIEE
ncbi:PDZ domain-containing protein [Candidatus Pacearchaeota archaeon]|nr:PDZ domain-containing protein [Candidatus Pacearchaeota archaeon]